MKHRFVIPGLIFYKIRLDILARSSVGLVPNSYLTYNKRRRKASQGFALNRKSREPYPPPARPRPGRSWYSGPCRSLFGL